MPSPSGIAATFIAAPMLILSLLGLRAIFDDDHPDQASWIRIYLVALGALLWVVGPSQLGEIVIMVANGFWGFLVAILSQIGGIQGG